MTKNIFKSTWTYIIIILIIIGAIYGYKTITKGFLVPGQYDEFAQYLTEQGVIMYGTEWCPHCKNNKELFGNSFQYVNYIDCDRNRDACADANIRGYPTWNVNGESYPGEQSLERLAQLANYPGEI
tara:strand:+ start:625 stop:1002 length:378 start_codon:yes stop_codon:yes gene_type:complete